MNSLFTVGRAGHGAGSDGYGTVIYTYSDHLSAWAPPRNLLRADSIRPGILRPYPIRVWHGKGLTLAEQIPTVESPAFPESPERGSGGRPLVLHRAPTWAVSAQKDPARILAPGVEHGRANVAIRMGRTRPHRPVQDDSVARKRALGVALSAVVAAIR